MSSRILKLYKEDGIMNCLLLLFFLLGSCFGPISSYIKYIVDISLDIPISARSWNNGFFFLFLFFLVANSNLLTHFNRIYNLYL